jgi:putative ABC transport system ATP-binding protein
MRVDEPVISLSHLSKIYQTADGGFEALKNISASFYPGEFVGILGKSGVGKTTLINMITATDSLTSGSVQVNGVSIHRLSQNQAARWRGKNMGIIYQTFRLMPTLSLIDNIMLSIDFGGEYRPRLGIERAMDLLKEMELEEHAFKHPSAISGGQAQRIAIARALANDPAIIIADEPTGRLDSVTAEMIFQIFEKLVQRGKLIIMATHDLSVVNRFTRYIMLSDGELVEDTGMPEE